MYNFDEEFRKFAETRFKAEFGYQYPTTPVQWDSFSFVQPTNKTWAAFTYNTNQEKQISIGKKVVMRTTGFIQIDINVPGETGMVEAKKIANFAAEIFAYKKFTGVTIKIDFSDKHVVKAPTSGAFSRAMARVFFHYDGERVRDGVQLIT